MKARTVPITPSDIVTAYRLILGREPEAEWIAYFPANLAFEDKAAFCRHLCKSEEFAHRFHLAASSAGVATKQQSADRMAINLGDRVLTRTHRGQKIFVVPDDLDLSPHIMLTGTWEPHVEQGILSLLRPGQRVCDCGANVGYHTIAMAETVGTRGHVDAFEARPQLARLLADTLFINGLAAFTRVHNVAVSDAPGSITLSAEPGHYGNGNIGFTFDGFEETYTLKFEVSAVRLDDVFPASTPPMDLLRFDIEGAEPLALRGAEGLLRRSPDLRIVTEWAVHMMQDRADVPTMVDWLEAMGFRFWHITGAGMHAPIDRATLLNLPHTDVVIARALA